MISSTTVVGTDRSDALPSGLRPDPRHVTPSRRVRRESFAWSRGPTIMGIFVLLHESAKLGKSAFNNAFNRVFGIAHGKDRGDKGAGNGDKDSRMAAAPSFHFGWHAHVVGCDHRTTAISFHGWPS